VVPVASATWHIFVVTFMLLVSYKIGMAVSKIGFEKLALTSSRFYR